MPYEVRQRKTNEVLRTYIRHYDAINHFCSHCNKIDHYIADINWREREAQREDLIDLTLYNLVPITDHFLHVSHRDDPSSPSLMVSYTENPLKGEEDKQVTGQNLGRYLKSFYPDLTSDQITAMTGEITINARGMVVHLAVSADEIADVYRRGPESCMSGEPSRFNLPKHLHPAMAYAGPDLAVAYLKDKKDRIISRCVVWPDKKIWVRIYGVPEKMEPALRALGYTQGSLSGARMSMLPIDANANKHFSSDRYAYFPFPYLDSGGAADVKDGYFVLGGNQISGGTQGWVSVPYMSCRISNQRALQGVGMVETQHGWIMEEFDTDEHVWKPSDENYAHMRFIRSHVAAWVDSFYGKIPREYARGYLTLCRTDNVYYPSSMLMLTSDDDYILVTKAHETHARCFMSGGLYPRGRMTELKNGQLVSNFYAGRQRNFLTEAGLL